MRPASRAITQTLIGGLTDSIVAEAVVRDHGIEWIDFLKLDCEGTEWDLLGVAPRDVLDRIRRGAAEVHGENRSALEPFLKEVGFQIYQGPRPSYLYFTRPQSLNQHPLPPSLSAGAEPSTQVRLAPPSLYGSCFGGDASRPPLG